MIAENKVQNQNNLYIKAVIANLISDFTKKLFFFNKKQEISILWAKLYSSGLYYIQIFIDNQYKKQKGFTMGNLKKKRKKKISKHKRRKLLKAQRHKAK